MLSSRTSRCPHSAPAQRNTGPILSVLREVLPAQGTVLEIASGTGQHVVAFAEALPRLHWQPSDVDATLRRSVELRLAAAGLGNIGRPLEVDVMQQPWAIESAAAVVCINMIHIAPWQATEGLFAGAARVLPPGGVLVTYGPYMRGGAHTAPSNEAFDATLRRQNPEWGLRDIDTIAEVARAHGFAMDEPIAMPANNFTLVFRCAEAAAAAKLKV